MSNNNELQMRGNSSWLGGFPNLLHQENRRWWGTRYWLVQLAIWLILVNGVIAAIYQMPPEEMFGSDLENTSQAEQDINQVMKDSPELVGLTSFLRLAGVVLVVGVVVIAQGAIIAEKQNGTSAWVLSKPVSRSAFILSKVVGYGLGILGSMCALLGTALYGQIWLTTGVLVPLLPFAGMFGLVFLNLLFYLTLTILIGTLSNGRGAALGIPLIVLFSYMLIPTIPSWLVEIMPWNLVDSLSYPAFALTVVQGQPLPSLTPVFATLIGCLLFTTVALWKFNQEEF